MSCDPEQHQELTREIAELDSLKQAIHEQTVLINALNERIHNLELVNGDKANASSLKYSAAFICTSVLLVSALFKCIIGLEAANVRIDTLAVAIGHSSKPSDLLLPSPKPLAPIVWISHVFMYLLSLMLSGLSSLVEQAMRVIMTAVAVTCVVLILLRNSNYKPSVSCEPN